MARTQFREAKLFRSIFTAAICRNADVSGANLSGSSFRNVGDARAIFIKVIFAGTDFSNGEFASADFSDAVFRAIEKYKGASFQGTTWKNASFDDRTDEFHQYIENHST
jgi:uncharacterized protein YjbI with pentapeptide repeats